MSVDVKRAIYAEEKRHLDEVKRLVRIWPEYRSHLGYALLASAIAVCDSYGLDVEGFLANLRKREAKPPVLVPAKGRQS